MFNVGDRLIYGTAGVCVIEGTCMKKFGEENREYFVIKPIYSENSTIFAPVGKPNDLMRPLLGKEELEWLLEELSKGEMDWISDHRKRKEKFGEIIKSGDRLNILKMIRVLYEKHNELLESNKRISSADENMLRTAERLMNEEFAAVFDIDISEVHDFILSKTK